MLHNSNITTIYSIYKKTILSTIVPCWKPVLDFGFIKLLRFQFQNDFGYHRFRVSLLKESLVSAHNYLLATIKLLCMVIICTSYTTSNPSSRLQRSIRCACRPL